MKTAQIVLSNRAEPPKESWRWRVLLPDHEERLVGGRSYVTAHAAERAARLAIKGFGVKRAHVGYADASDPKPQWKQLKVTIKGTSPLIVHRWSERIMRGLFLGRSRGCNHNYQSPMSERIGVLNSLRRLALQKERE